MLKDLSTVNWINLIFAMIFVSGPGWILITLIPNLRKLNFLSKLLLAYCIIISLFSLYLSFGRLTSLEISWDIVKYILILSWVIILFQFKNSHRIKNKSFDFYQFFLLLIIFLVLFIILFNLRNIVAGLGSDSYHHTLITQLILDQGKAPNNYEPYAPIISFSYHFGFHALSALLSYFSGIPVRLIIPITGVLILGLATLSTYFLSLQLFQNNRVSFLTGLLTICTSVLPYYLINFSRFPQLLGLVFCGVLVSLFILWHKENFSINFIPIISLITLGQAFTHYRITIMSLIGISIFILFITFEEDNKIHFLKKNFLNWLLYGLSTIILFAPWFIKFLILQQNGYSGEIGGANEQFFSIDRLGSEVNNYITNLPIMIIFSLAILLAIKDKIKKVILLFSWSAVLLFLSGPFFLGTFMDTVSVIFSLYVPILIVVGWFLIKFIEKINLDKGNPKFIFTFIIILIISPIFLIPSHIHPEFSFVSSEDLVAFEWIKENTQDESKFIVNTFNFNFNENYIIGIDAGYWIPLLANRETVTIPMIYQIEKLQYENTLENLILVHNIVDYSSNETINLLSELGYTHIYIGEWGSKEKLNQLLENSYYKLIFNEDNAYVFEISIED